MAQIHPSLNTISENKGLFTDEQIQVFSKMLDDMVFVEGGDFYMGSDENTASDNDDNTPIHKIFINNFFISRYEVTQEQWKLVMGENPSEFYGEDLPVENVSWEDCQRFITKLNAVTELTFRLPTEAEWEYAAAGGLQSVDKRFAGSDFVSSVAWTYQNSDHHTHTIATKRPNSLDIYDMSGNVAEWCADFYHKNYYLFSDTDNPKGPSSGHNRVNRGGAWQMDIKYADIHYRNLAPPDTKNHGIGLRLAM